MSDPKKDDKSHRVLSEMAEFDVEQPGDTPSESVSDGTGPEIPDDKTNRPAGG